MPDVHYGSSHGMHRHRPVLPWVWLALAVVLGFFLFTEHRAHLFGALPFLLVLLLISFMLKKEIWKDVE